MKFTPVNKQLLVEKIENTETKIIGNMFIPDVSRDKMSTCQARVIKVSPRTTDYQSVMQPGDVIFIRNWSGNEVIIDGKEYHLLSEFEVLGFWRE